jgi:hypothetical protein
MERNASIAGLRFFLEDLHKDLDWLQDRNQEDDLRCRELSLAITEIEAGSLWLEYAITILENRAAARDD